MFRTFLFSSEIQTKHFLHYFLHLSRPRHTRHLPTVTASVSFLQNLVETLNTVADKFKGTFIETPIFLILSYFFALISHLCSKETGKCFSKTPPISPLFASWLLPLLIWLLLPAIPFTRWTTKNTLCLLKVNPQSNVCVLSVSGEKYWRRNDSIRMEQGNMTSESRSRRFLFLLRWWVPQLQRVFWRRKPESAFHLSVWRVGCHKEVYCFTSRLWTRAWNTEPCHSGGKLGSLPSAKVSVFVSKYVISGLFFKRLPRWVRLYI